jgi:hypothetical protein
MKLLAPAWLGLLLLAIPILLLHMRRTRTVLTSSLLLWRGVSGRQQARRSWQRPPLSAALLLQLLALALAALILARPVTADSNPQHLLLLLDASGGPAQESRFAASLQQAARLTREHAAHEGALWSLILVTDQPRWLAARWPATADALSALEAELQPGGGTADWPEAARLARTILNEAETSRVVLLGSPAGQRPVAAALPEADVTALGGSAPPAVSFAAARLEQLEDSAQGGPLRVSGELTGNSTSALLSATFTAAPLPGQAAATPVAIGQLEVGLAAGDSGLPRGEFQWQLELPAAGVLTLAATALHQAGTGSGGADHEASFVLHEEPLRFEVLYVGPGNPPLQQALQALPQVGLTEMTSLPADSSGYGLVILDGVTVPAEPQASTLWLGSARTRGAPEAQPASTAVTGWQADHPLAEGQQWSALTIGSAFGSEVLPGAAVLLSGSAGPLIQARATAGGHQLWISFDLAASDWPAHAGFPLFIRNLIRWIEPAAGQLVPAGCSVGRTCSLPAFVRSGQLLDPAGQPVSLPQLELAGTSITAQHFTPQRAGTWLLADAAGAFRPLAVNDFRNGFPAADRPAAGNDAQLLAGRAPGLRSWLLAALLLVLACEGWLAYRRRQGAPPRRGWLLPGLRLGLLLLVGLALADLRLPLPRHSAQLVVLRPEESSADSEQFERNLADLLAGAAARDRVSVVSAGAAAVLGGQQVAPAAAARERGMNLAEGLQLASALLTRAAPGRIVLAGDGAQTRGDYLAELARLPAGRQLDALPSGPAPAGEVLVHSLVPPAAVLAGDRFTLDALIHSGSAQPASLTVFRNGEETMTRDVQLVQGSNRFGLVAQETEPGSVLYQVQVTAPADTVSENNLGGAWVQARPALRVLLVAGQPEWNRVLASALELQGADVTLVAPAGMPAALAELLDFQVIMLSGVPALDLGTARQELLETVVQDYGRTLFLLGGENTFGPGGYFGTPLERLSPASSLVPRETPAMALAFVLDRSNSMRQYAGDAVRLDIAKAATIRAFELLPDQARVALVVFDSTARTLVPLREVRDDAELSDAVRQLEPRGGTALYPALVEAHAQLQDNGAAASHMIVMSDGLSQPGDFPGIMKQITDAGITVSTIAIGPEADFAQLEEIARQGGGSFHASRDFSELPGIMAHEMLLLDGELIEERPVRPAWLERSPDFLQDWPGRLPPVTGFVRTAAKPGADVHLQVASLTGEDLPLLSSWPYGAGRVVAFTAQAAGPWTAAWLALPDYPLLWGQLLRQSVLPAQQPGLNLQFTRSADTLNVTLDVLDELEAVRPGLLPELRLSGGGREVPLRLHEVAPGRYAGSVVTAGPGDYLLEAAVGGQVAALPVHLAWPAVADFSLADEATLEAAALMTGGRVLQGGEALRDVLVASRQWHWSAQPAWPWLCLLAAALLLLELAGRYSPWPRRRSGRPAP